MISGRLANKPSRKERPKSCDKGNKGARKSRDAGVPDTTSPTVVGIVESETESPGGTPYVPLDAEAQQLLIDHDEMKSRRQPHPPSMEKATKKVYVRKNNMSDNSLDSAKTKRILVAKIASESGDMAASQSATTDRESIKETETIKPHAILGSVYDFQDEMKRKGIEVNVESYYRSKLHSSKRVRILEEQHSSPKEILKTDGNMNDVNALENWERRMKERKRQQDYLQGITNKSGDALLMNTSDVYFQMQLEREVIHRAMPSVEYGKGFRVGSEFWRLGERIGDEDSGITVSLTKSEKGQIPPIEHIGKPSTIMKEVNGPSDRLKDVSSYYPWWKSSYLKKRKGELKDVMEGLVPHDPYINELEIIGQALKKSISTSHATGRQAYQEREDKKNPTDVDERKENKDPFEGYTNVVPLPIFGPSLVINGQSLQWTGSDTDHRNVICPVVRLLFQAPIHGSSLNAIDITNDGTAAIYYSWQLQRPVDPFGRNNGRPIQRFYFDIRNGVVLPGNSVKLNFSFKSPNAGIFSEIWVFETNPTLCGGAPIKVALQGIATSEDTLREDRLQLEKELANREALHAVERIIKDILSGVRTPPRPSTPEDAYLTEEDIFGRMNEKLEFDSEIVTQLSALYSTATDGETWDLSVDSLRDAIKAMEDEEEIEIQLEALNTLLAQMSKKRIPQVENLIYSQSYQLLCDALDQFSDQVRGVQVSLGIPERELVVQASLEEVTKKGKRTDDKTSERKMDLKKERREHSPNKGKSSGNSKSRSKESVLSKPDPHETETKSDVSDFVMSELLAKKYSEKLYTILYGSLADAVQKMEEIVLPPKEISSMAQ